MALHLHRDHLPRLRQRLHPSLHLTNGRQPAVDQYQRFAVAVLAQALMKASRSALI
jgi:hypothetical protein